MNKFFLTLVFISIILPIFGLGISIPVYLNKIIPTQTFWILSISFLSGISFINIAIMGTGMYKVCNKKRYANMENE